MESKTFNQRTLSGETLLLDPGTTLDNSNVQELVKVLSGAQDAGFRNVILDMSQLEFISSAGVGAIFSKSEAARRRGGDIVLCNVSGNILYVLGELDVADHLTIKPSEQEAAAFCKVRL